MYSLQQSNELENQIPYTLCQPDQIPLQDLLTFETHNDLRPVISKSTGKKQRRSSTESQEKKKDHHEGTNNGHKLKKIMHRDIERQRRQEMASLYASLRSLLPLEYIKGKRAISDHMQEATNYIKSLEKNITELRERKERLIRSSNLSNTLSSGNGSADSFLSNVSSVTVNPCRDGVEVLISSGYNKEESFPLSGVLRKLIGEGLNVVSCVSTKANETLVHRIVCEVPDGNMDIIALQQKLNGFNLESNSD